MYSITINTVLTSDPSTKKKFIGVFAKDELPLKLRYPCCFVFNTEKKKEDGEHWLAAYFDKNKTCWFFDSYGQSPHFYDLYDYLKHFSKKIVWNKLRIQGFSDYCGFYCIFFIAFKCRNKISSFYNIFTKNCLKNDSKLLKYIKYL